MCRMGKWFSLLVVAIAVSVGAGAGHSRAVVAQTPLPRALRPLPAHISAPTLASNIGDLSLQKTDKISPELDKLYRIDEVNRAVHGPGITSATAAGAGPDVAGLLNSKRLRMVGGTVQVWIDAATDPRQTAGDVAALGGEIQRVDPTNKIVQAMLPVSALAAVSQLSSANNVRLPEYGFLASGSQLTQGDGILGSATLRSELTASGAGVTVGVMSDGMEGRTTAQASGDLPSGNNLDITTCNMEGAAAADASGAGAEGTAMAEIVHDIAPGAKIMFGYFGYNLPTGGTPVDFNAAVNCLAQHADIVVDDVGWFDVGPYDGTSMVSQNTTNALNNAANRIRGYYTANANQAAFHYREPYVYSGFDVTLGGNVYGLQQFQSTSATTDGGSGLQCTAIVRCGDTIALDYGQTFSVFLEWNDPFGSSTNDYDLLVQDNTSGTLTAVGINRQSGSFHDPIEEFSLTNNHNTGSPTVYSILIGNYHKAAAAKTFNMYIICPGCYGFPTGLAAPDDVAGHNYNTLSHSVPNQSDAGGGVISVGAISASNSPNYDTEEFYSSRGPTDAVTNNTKPDIAGIDCVNVTGDGGFEQDFCGTSAAAPHVAAIAALLLSCNPTLVMGNTGSLATTAARTELRSALLGGATALGAVPNNTFGYGRVNTMNSAPLAGCVDTDGDGYPDGLETTLGKNPSTYCAAMRADLNGDGVVNGLDLAMLATVFTESVPPAGARIDQTADGTINGLDLADLATQFLKNVSSCP